MKLASLALTLLMSALSLWPQATQVSQITGTTLDGTGAAIPGTVITVTNLGTGIAKTITSGPDGEYLLTNLPAGQYRLQARKPGFAAYLQNGIVLEVNSNPHIDVSMKVGDVSEQIEVSANAAMVETHSNGVGQVIDQNRVVELPLNGRNITQLVTLAGGATDFVPVNASQSLISNKNYPTSSAFSVAGGQGGQTLFLLDGGNNMDVVSNIGLPMPFPDALQEFKVETSSLPANYGSQPGGVVNVVTKSGGNTFHGNAFEFLRNYAANARNFFAPTRDSLKRNQFGGTLGGPIRKNRLFFFGGYQGMREKVAPAANIAFVETAAMLQGDFTAFAACSKVTLRTPFVNNQVAPNLLNPVALKLLKLMPVSNDPCGKLTYGIPSRDHENQFVVRVDAQISEKQSVFVRYFVTDYQHPPSYSDNNLLTMSTDASAGLSDRVNTAVVGHTYTLGPATINTFRAGFSRQSVIRYMPDSIPTPTQLGANVYEGVPGYNQFTVTGYFQPVCTNCSPGPWISTNYQLSNELTLIRGAHQIALGVNATNSRLNSFSNFQRNGNFTFNGQNTGNALADLMVGVPSGFTQNNGQIGDERLTQPSLYVQDNIRRRRFTFNIGVRWDPYMSPWKAVPQVSIFDPGWYAAGIRSSVFVNAPAGTLFVGDKNMPGNHYFNGRLGQFAPRVGVVFDPRGKAAETIRAGFGIFYGGTPLWLQAGIFAPFTAPINIPNPAGGLSDPYKGAIVSNPYPVPNPIPANVAFPLFGGGLGNFKLNPKPTYMEQWNLSFQKQLPGDWLFSASYLGNRTVHLEIGEPYNPAIFVSGNCVAGQYGLSAAGPCSNTSNANNRRVLYLGNPSQAQYYGGLTAFGDGANASYNGLLVSVQHRFTHNFTVLANDTWSHCLNESEVALNGGGFGQDAFNRHAEYGNCLSGRKQTFNLTSVIASPKFASPWLARIAGGWQESTIFTAATGSYSTVTVGTDNSRTGNGADRPNLVGDPNLSTPTILQWFNKAAFQAGPVGTFGNLGRSTILGPGAWNIDVALSRSFAFAEHQRIDLRAEAFNLLNHARFLNPSTAMNSATFGQITAARDPRIMQFALKYVF